MRTTESECLEALREAAERLGESPTKAAYERLDLTPASTTICRVVGGWNEAKEKAGLRTYEQDENGGTDVRPKPDWVDIPEEKEWTDLSAQQRWYYKNRKHRIRIKEDRRREIKRWFYELKRDEYECSQCDEDRPPALDFHHEGVKGDDVSAMVNDGYARSRIREEIDRCIVLCANCHRKEHYGGPDPESLPDRSEIAARLDEAGKDEARKLRRSWLVAYKRDADGCESCRVDSPVCLDFHHVGDKTKRVSHMVSSGWSLSEIIEEIERCVLLCVNCHRDRHFEPPTPRRMRYA